MSGQQPSTSLLSVYASADDIEREKRHFDPSTPLEIVIISAVMKGLQVYAEDTANDEVADGFSGEEARLRAHSYYECREQLQAYWSRL